MGLLPRPPRTSDLDGPVPESLHGLVRNHVASFDSFVERGLAEVVKRLPRVAFQAPGTTDPGSRHELWFESVTLGKPGRGESDGAAGARARDPRVFPRECREASMTYKAPMRATVCWRKGVGGGGDDDDDASSETVHRREFRLCAFPAMVGSAACHLQGLTKAELVRRGEEAHETGGYFICNGNERVVRLLIQQRRHYVMAMRRGAYASRGPAYTEFATAIRCVTPDEHSGVVRVHYLNDGGARVAFVYRRQEYFIPAGLIFRALSPASDRELADLVASGVPGPGGEAFAAERIVIVLEEAASLGVRTRAQALAYLGEHFRAQLDAEAWETNAEVGARLLSEFFFVHLVNDGDKSNLLVYMLQKLYALVTGACSPDNPDSTMHHEILLPGLLMQTFTREKLGESLRKARDAIARELDEKPQASDLDDPEWFGHVATRAMEKMDLGRLAEYFLATGNLASKSGLGLSQTSGFTIVADKLNYARYVSHFRSVHRGAYFAELRTTTVRKLLPESWGFLCPVHTPDGSPCGLLMHLAAACRVSMPPGGEDEDSSEKDVAAICKTLASAGVLLVTSGRAKKAPPPPAHLTVMLDGAVLGTVRASEADAVAAALRAAKTASPPRAPAALEVALIPPSLGGGGGAFPGIYLFTSPSRMVRPVRQTGTGRLELVSSLEQAFMAIKCPDGGAGGSERFEFTHEETGPGAMLSAIASLTPWSDYNQSPRNMYQCQMGKQTMGVPLHSFKHRPDTKLYRLQTPQRPIAATDAYDRYAMDEYPLGTNAVVAVLAYTGYDMEDAMIVNKGSMERGLAHATLYKTDTIAIPANDQGDERFGKKREATAAARGTKKRNASRADGAASAAPDATVDEDGAPRPGSIVEPGSAVASVLNRATGRARLTKLKGADRAVVDRVAIARAPGARGKRETKMSVTLRFNRNPIIGDKFSSRHGQKGVLSFLWPEEDLPYCERTGVRPDILINPHAFPSRMTIGMLVESMASKAGAMDGAFVDASPFQAARDGERFRHPVEEHGATLRKHGFNYAGSETMVSGFTGEAFDVDIYVGLVYYQRLRHMVSDKFQVRALGPNNPLTNQPIKGRKAGGGIRFGEMERDALLAHGAAYLLHDRLHACSDRHVADVCSHCGSLLAPAATLRVTSGGAEAASPGGAAAAAAAAGARPGKIVGRVCATAGGVERVALPYVFKYLASELAAMNIRLGLEIDDPGVA